jgi:hypothetical protein
MFEIRLHDADVFSVVKAVVSTFHTHCTTYLISVIRNVAEYYATDTEFWDDWVSLGFVRLG